jgi:acrylyl-CoA reductase (NADPH)
VAPFILRGVTLAGVDSVMAPRELRTEAWGRLARDMPLDLLDGLVTTHPLADAPQLAAEILDGKVRGRVVFEVG